MDKSERRKPRKEKGRDGAHIRAASFSFVVSDQAICKHEGAALWSWQKRGNDENDNIEIETNEKVEGRLRDDGALIRGEILPLASNSCLQCAETRGNGMGGNKGAVKALIHVPGE